MFTVISIMAAGIAAGHILRKVRLLQQLNRSISWTIWLMLLFLGIAVGSNPQVMGNLGGLGGTALVISLAGTTGSLVMAWVVYRIFFKEEER